MADSKKYDGSQWEHSLRKLGTATETLTLPQIIYADGTAATVSLKGNTVQNGTPSPSNPVDVVGVGELETSGEHSGEYKIPISSANTTTPVYLGEVETTRRIKKLVLTGEEDAWNKSGAYQGSFYLAGGAADAVSLSYQAYCSHATFTTLDQYTRNTFCFNGGPINLNLWIGESSWTTDDFKTYLQQQYAAGTPVTVWYVLATPTTGIVNEPIRKIGNYADTVSGITIPTIAGADSFDVLTTLKPSEVSLTYTGWHDATVKEWDGSQWS